MASKEKEAPPKKGGKGGMLVLIVLSLVAMGAGAATPWVLRAGSTTEGEASGHGSASASTSGHGGGHGSAASSGHGSKSSSSSSHGGAAKSSHGSGGGSHGGGGGSHGGGGAHGKGDVSSVIPLCEATSGLLESGRYLRVKMMVAVEDKDSHDVGELLNKKKAYLKSWLLSYMSDLSVKDVARKAGVNRMKREVRDQFNVMLFPDGDEKILEVLFDEYVIQ